MVLRSNLLFLGLIALMPFPVRLLSDYSDRPLAVAVYAVAFIAAMVLQLVIWLDVTRPERGDLLSAPVPDEVRTGFGRALGGMVVVPAAAGGGTIRAPVRARQRRVAGPVGRALGATTITRRAG